MDSKQKLFAILAFCLSMALVFGVAAQTAVANQAYTHNALTDKVDELILSMPFLGRHKPPHA
jgi:hypothetical protein